MSETTMSEKLFVAIDPSDTQQEALYRAIQTATLRKSPPKIKVFVVADSESKDTRAINDNLFRDENWFKSEIKDRLEAAKLEYSIEMCWSHEWQKAVVESSNRFGADRIYLRVNEKTNNFRFSFSDAKWDLLKTASCPVVLIQPKADSKREVILAAVNFQAIKDEQQALNRSIIESSKAIAQMYGAELHIVNAYVNQMNYPDRGQLVIQSGLDTDHIHVEEGYTNEAVAKVAKSLKADLVIMGTLGQNGSRRGSVRTFRGNTAARLIAKLSQDIMVVNQ